MFEDCREVMSYDDEVWVNEEEQLLTWKEYKFIYLGIFGDILA